MDNRSDFLAFYNRRLGKICPAYGILPLLACFVVNSLIYWGAQLLCMGRYHHDFTMDIDRSIPFDSRWVIIYVLSYLFWAICYIMGAKYNSKEDFYRFVFADILSRVICFVIFVAMPTTNVRPEVPGDAACGWLMELIFSLDKPTNLFPSIHCIASMMCYFAVWRAREVRWYVKAVIAVFAVLVFASTQFTKQHYIVDVLGALAVGTMSFALSQRTDLYVYIMSYFEKLNKRVIGEDVD